MAQDVTGKGISLQSFTVKVITVYCENFNFPLSDDSDSTRGKEL